MKALFAVSRNSLGSRQMMKKLRKEGFEMGRYRVRNLMKRFGLVVKQQKRLVLTTDSKHQLPSAEDFLNRAFMPAEKRCVWTTGITYVCTLQGWVYPVVVIDQYSHRIVGWHGRGNNNGVGEAGSDDGD
jgi:putative transposase